MIKFKNGNLLDMAEAGDFDLIVHGCNCLRVMDGGIAKQIKDRYPNVYLADLDFPYYPDDTQKLGNYSFAKVEEFGFYVMNAYTQYDCCNGGDFEVGAFVLICDKIKNILYDNPCIRIGFPKIGAGIGGGDWKENLKIIKWFLGDFDITIVEYNKEEIL